METTAVIEAILIASEEPLPTAELARLIRARVAEADELIKVENEDNPDATAQLDPALAELAATSDSQVITAISRLNQIYETSGRSFTILERAKGWKIYTCAEYADFVRQMFPGQKPQRLSGPAMETLAIVAYRQPITKAAIEAVRGVSCDGMLQKLLDRELVCIGGRADLPGRPLLYETTDLFFEHFGIKTVNDLPNASELRTIKLPEPEEKDTEETSPEPENEEDQMPKNEFEDLDLTSSNSNTENTDDK